MKIIKKHQKLIVFVITCFSIYFIYNYSGEQNKITYITLGDGYAEGLNSYQQPSYGYSDYLKDYYEERDELKFYYDGYTNKEMTLKDLKKDIELNTREKDGHTSIKEALRESNLLTMSVGLNDIRHKLSECDQITKNDEKRIEKEITNQVEETIKELRKYYKYDIYIIEYPNLYPQNSMERRLLTKLNNKYKSLSKEKYTVFVENPEIEKNREKYVENPKTIYLNSFGYKKIFENIKANIEK